MKNVQKYRGSMTSTYFFGLDFFFFLLGEVSVKLIFKIVHRLFVAQDKEIYTISESSYFI